MTRFRMTTATTFPTKMTLVHARELLSNEEDIGGYPIPQYRKKNWQIPKYRVKNRRNTDTAFMIGHVYLKLYPFRVLVNL